MAKSAATPFTPDYAVHPGETLQESLEKTGMTQTDLAARTGLHRKTINGIVNGKERITPDTAILLERVFGVPARFWNNLQNNYDEASARLRERRAMEKSQAWVEKEGIPYGELVKRHLLPRTKDPVERVSAVLAFYGVASPKQYSTVWEETLQVCNFRKADAHQTRFGAVSAWLRLGELQAEQVACQPYDKGKLQTAVRILRSVYVQGWIPDSQTRLRGVLADCGVAWVLVPPITGAPLYGATRWLNSGKAVVQMSLRGKDDGNFWFTLFHELAHILLHGKKDVFLEMTDGGSTAKEEQADAFAREILIPRHEYEAFVRECGGNLSAPEPLLVRKSAILDFASRVRVPAGVVVGRLQRDRWLRYDHGNELKVHLDFAE